MKRFIERQDRSQTTLLPDCLGDCVDEDNPVRAIDSFVDMLDLAPLGFAIESEATGRSDIIRSRYNIMCVIEILGVPGLVKAMKG